MLARIRVPVRCALRAAGGCGGAAPPCSAPQLPPPLPSVRRSLVLCCAAAARSTPPADVFGADNDDFGLNDERPMSRTAAKKQSDDFRRLCQELTTLPTRTLNRLALPADLRESIDEHVRIGGKRGSGSTKKGRARVEALMAQIMRSYAPEKAAKILAAGNAAILGEPFQPVETGGEYTGRPTRARLAAAASDGDEEQAEEQAAAWLRGLLAGDAGTSTQVFDALSAAETETSLDRVQLRQLISKAQSEERAAAEAAEAAAAAAAAATAAAAAAAAEAGEVQQLRPPTTGMAKRKTAPATQRLLDALVGLARASEEGSGEDSDEDES